jgi:hypothetical protein
LEAALFRTGFFLGLIFLATHFFRVARLFFFGIQAVYH